ncbi:cache domain-containing sensor histidine kinase [Neobacillus cucumis]|uniref:histidine kinase n=1 Tax=Neobacillus cucumis TaxID=1740721 RepID=A0A2N5HCF2_9BACI|nr:sensor histidine kinase [Neobacillus cucumis]PLS03201.1 sensor histidine kinase [Neobacillus cucumis]
MQWGIRKKLIVTLMAVIILPFGIAITITYYQTTKSINDRFVSTNHDLIVKGEQELSTYLEDVAQMSTVLYRYTPFMSVMRVGISDDLSSNQEEVRRMLAYTFNSRPEVEQMHLYIDRGKDSYTNYHSRISGRGKYESILSNPFYARLSRSHDFSVIEPPHEIYSYNNLSVIPKSEKNQVLSFHTIIRDVPLEKILGFVSIDINLSKIRDIAGRLYTDGVEDLYIMNDEGVVVYSSKKDVIGKENKEAWYKQIKKEPKDQKSLEWKDEKFSGVIVYQKFSDSFKNWYIVKRIPYDVLYQGARQTVFTNIIIVIITLIIVLIATMFISFRLTAPIKVLIANMKKVEKGVFEADFESLGKDEIGMLGRHFKLMIAKINELFEREYKLEIENKSSQLRVLQSQINPHFLYNAFQSIGTLALQLKAVPVYSLLTSLSNIMRYSMNMKDDIVPFSAEINHVKAYLKLQKQRFEEQLEFEFDLGEDVDEVLVPKMILQPIVENCFKHGFDQQIEKTAVTVQARIFNDYLYISVKDNGIGISEENLEKLRRELSHNGNRENLRSSGIGLKNIYDRLKIYYSKQADMDVFSGVEGGFVVTLAIPRVIHKEVVHP